MRLHAVAALSLAMLACGDDSPGPVPPAPPPGTMVVEPGSLALTDTKRSDKLFVSTTPSGSQVSWQIAQKPDWLSLAPDHGTVSSPMEVTVTASGVDTLPAGIIGGQIRLVSNGGGGGVQVSLEVKPTFSVAPSVATVQVPDTAAARSFVLKNTGNTAVTWSLVPSASWLKAAPTSGNLARRDSVSITVTPDRRSLPAGTSTASLVIQLSGGSGPGVSVPVSVQVAAIGVPSTSLSRVVVTTPSTGSPFVLFNRGKGPLSWTASSAAAWLSFQPAGGTIQVGDSTAVTARVDWALVPGLSAEGTGQITGNGQPASIPLAVVASTFTPLGPGTPYGIAGRVVDAEYDRAGDRVLAVTTAPNGLVLLDPVLPQQTFVPLSAAPTSISIRPDGRFAAVGFDGAVGLFDLATRTMVRMVPVSADVLDLVLAQNNWAYVFPRRDQWVALRNVNLNAGVDLPSKEFPPLYAGTVGRLHPDGHSLYMADNGLSPSDFIKYDVTDTLATRLYDSRYHGDFAFDGNLWYNDDGSQLIARSGNVFAATANPATDITYLGRLQGVTRVEGAVHDARRGRIYALTQADPFTPGAPELRVHAAALYPHLGSVPLPGIVTGAGTVPAWGRYVFLSADQSRLVVLVEADPSIPLAQPWSVLYLATAGLP